MELLEELSARLVEGELRVNRQPKDHHPNSLMSFDFLNDSRPLQGERSRRSRHEVGGLLRTRCVHEERGANFAPSEKLRSTSE